MSLPKEIAAALSYLKALLALGCLCEVPPLLLAFPFTPLPERSELCLFVSKALPFLLTV